jgi:secreted PhoX family phosphatase
MGRFAHEDAHLMPDHQTVYLTDDNSPSVWFKFVSKNAANLTEGQLYAYTEVEKNGSHWLALPMDFNTMVYARDTAIAMGATLFNRLEWIEMVGDYMYVTETGRDMTDWKDDIKAGGRPASHLERLATGKKGKIADPYGRVLKFDPNRDEFSVFLEGGIDMEKGISFTNPDALTQVNLKGKDYLVIHEDIIGTSMGRSGALNATGDDVYNEVFFIDTDKDNPSLADLNRLLVAPRGCETTGGYFNPEGDSFFLNIQEPDRSNPPPFNKSHTIVIQGFKP